VILARPPDTAFSPETQGNFDSTGYPDPEVKHHEHGEGATDQMTDQNSDPLYIEWVYVLDPVSGLITVFCSRKTADLKPGQHGTWSEPITLRRLDGTVEQLGGHHWVHVLAGQFSVHDPEPDWDRIQCGEHLDGVSSWNLMPLQSSLKSNATTVFLGI
jgi:hypothetical protein